MNTTSLSICGNDHLPTEKLKKCTRMNRCFSSLYNFGRALARVEAVPSGKKSGHSGTDKVPRDREKWKMGSEVVHEHPSPLDCLLRDHSRMSTIITNSLFLLRSIWDSFNRSF